MKKEIAALSFATLAATAGCTTEKAATPAPSPVETTLAPTEAPIPTLPERITLSKADIDARLAKAQKGITAVSAEKMKEFISIVEEKGYIDSDVKSFRRLVVKAKNGNVYTNEIDYAKPIGSKNNSITGVTVYIRKPGEAHAQHVITDGTVFAEYDRVMPVNGKIDQAIGYTQYSEAQTKADLEKYDAEDALFIGNMRDLETENTGGFTVAQTAQEDFARAINITTARY